MLIYIYVCVCAYVCIYPVILLEAKPYQNIILNLENEISIGLYITVTESKT